LDYCIELREEKPSEISVVVNEGWVDEGYLRLLLLCKGYWPSSDTEVLLERAICDCYVWILRYVEDALSHGVIVEEISVTNWQYLLIGLVVDISWL
jgi:hypothetical protein